MKISANITLSRTLKTASALILLCLLPAAYSIDAEQFSINGFTSIRMDKQVDQIGFGDRNYSLDAELFDLLMNFQIGEQMRMVSNLSWNHGAEKEYGYTRHGAPLSSGRSENKPPQARVDKQQLHCVLVRTPGCRIYHS